MLDFLVDSARNGFPTLPKLSEDDVTSIWASVSQFIENQMALQKGVQIPGLGTFTLSQHKLDMGNKFILMQRPIFLLSEKLAQVHNLQYNKQFTTGDIPVVPLNYIALSLACSFNRDIIKGCVKETISAFSRSIAIKQNVEFIFRGIGLLLIRDPKVKMKFYKEFVNSLDGTGNLVKSLSNRPGTCDSVMSGRESALLRPSSCSAVLFPRIEVKEADNAPVMETITEENGDTEYAQGQNSNEHVENERDGDDTMKRECTPSKRFLNRQCIIPTKVTGISFSQDLERLVKPKTAPERLGSSFDGNVSKAEVEGFNSQTEQIRLPSPPGCIDHCRAGQELCYLCMQRAQKNIPVYFTEERKLKEQDEDRLLQHYQHMKDQEALQKAQLALLMSKEQRQKDAAYNLGVADAIRSEKNQRPLGFYKSYIFQKRPLTPPAIIKQEQYYHNITRQMAERKDKEVRVKQDKELLDRLEQVQLAEELAAQRAKYVRERNKQILCYKSALDTQVQMKPCFVLPIPKVMEAPFGKNDMTNEKLVEKKKRAQEVYRHQVEAAADRKRLVILNELVKQKKEGEMLHKSKQESVADRAAQYNKMSRLQRALQEDWTKTAQLKRQKDQDEERFIHAGSHLLLDQFEKYRRCFQCKRRTSNCGETNVWCESRYIPGSRLMV
ncbi:coiled-coil domain-containing protein 81 isoform 2-T2 [Pelodytes ibericus]